MPADHGLERLGGVADDADAQSVRTNLCETGKRVGIEIAQVEHRCGLLDAEQLPHAVVALAPGDQAAQRRHQREARDAGAICRALPETCLVDEGLAGVEDHRSQSHVETSSRSTGSVTLSSFGSPSTTHTRPRAVSTSEAQSVAPAMSPPSAVRSAEASKAWGVCAAIRPSRSSVSTISSPRTRLIVSLTGTAGTTPSQPSESGASTRAITSSVRSGRAASCTTITAASSGIAGKAARTDSARVSPPVTAVATLSHASSSASRIDGSSQSGG